jgi:hypothetical protein
MKPIVISLLVSIGLLSLFVFCEDKPTNPPPSKNPGYYYPRQTNYGWRYIHLIKPECYEIHDSFDYKIVAQSVRHGDAGFDRLWVGSQDTFFLYIKADTLFEENVQHGWPIFKTLVGPIEAGTSWKDDYYYYLIQKFEDVTLKINDATYKGCAKIIKTPRNPSPSKPHEVDEWWVPGYGKIREMEVDTLGVCQNSYELRSFTTSGEFP